MPILYRDFETRSFADLKRVGAQRYAADPTTEVVCVCYCVDDGPIETFIPDNNEPIPKVFEEAANNPEWRVAAHNDAFESAIEEYVLKPRYNWPLVPIERHICSMAAAQYHGLPGALEKIAAILALPIQKDIVGKQLTLRLSKPKRGHDGAWYPRNQRDGSNIAKTMWRSSAKYCDACRSCRHRRWRPGASIDALIHAAFMSILNLPMQLTN